MQVHKRQCMSLEYARTSEGAAQTRSVVLGVAAIVIGLLTTCSGVVIELTSGLVADLRHGVCVRSIPGDTRPLWDATFGGGWRPYDRTRCCGGSGYVDHATQECRAISIIQHSTHKGFASPIPDISFGKPVLLDVHPRQRRVSFSAVRGRFITDDLVNNSKVIYDKAETREGWRQAIDDKAIDDLAATRAIDAKAIDDLAATRSSSAGGSREDWQHYVADLAALRTIEHTMKSQGKRAHTFSASRRSDQTRDLVGADASRVRNHMSELFAPDPLERWAEEATADIWGSHRKVMSAEATEVSVNEGVVQTQSESAGSLAPTYEWVPWERALMVRGRSASFCIYVIGSAVAALLAALVTLCYPAAKGSGIPEVKASVAGFSIPKSFQVQTLAAKVLGLALCVGAGLAVGKEGPMIHIGACWGALLWMLFSRLGYIPSALAETEFICVGAAAGVSAAFGAPLGGVLFAVEELGATLPTGLRYSTMVYAFVSAVVAVFALKWLDLTHTQRLTLFEVDYKQSWAPWEAIPFLGLGVVGGLLGGVFVLANESVHKRRMRAEAEGQLHWCLTKRLDQTLQRLFRVPPGSDARVLEVVLLAIFTGISNYPHALTRMLQNDAIKALFSQCPVGGPSNIHDPVGLCSAHSSVAMVKLLQLLVGAAALRLLQATVTFGALTPAGLFVPSLFTGGCIGRAAGALLQFHGFAGVQGVVEPGIYAMVGAGAVLAGVSRLTISLVVVLFELTGGLTYVVPFMLAVLMAKWTGDAMTDGRSVYDVHAVLKGFTKVEQSDDVRVLNATLEDLFDVAANRGDAIETGGTLASDIPPALWMSSTCDWCSTLALHCRSVGGKAGFAVLSSDGGEVEVLGWARSSHVLSLLAERSDMSEDVKLESYRALQAKKRVPSKWAPTGGEVTEILETKGVVRVRSDCSVQTAHCIFQNCPHVHALVSIDGRPMAARTITREMFMSKISQGCLCAIPSPEPLKVRV